MLQYNTYWEEGWSIVHVTYYIYTVSYEYWNIKIPSVNAEYYLCSHKALSK